MTEENLTPEPEAITEETEALPEESAIPEGHRKVVVDGEELVVSLDEMDKGYQTARSSTKRYQEAAQLKKEADEYNKRLLENPIEVLAEKMSTEQIREITEAFLVKQLEEEALSPEQLQARNEKAELEILRKEKAELEEQSKSKELEAQTSHAADVYEKQFISALDEINLPKNPTTVKRMAIHMQDALNNGYELSASQAARMVQEDLQTDLTSLYGALEPERLASLLGKDVVEKVGKYRASQLKNPFNPTPARASESTPKSNERQFVSEHEFMEQTEKLFQ